MKIVPNQAPTSNGDRVLRLPDVKAKIGLSRSSIYAQVKVGTFPAPLNLGGGRSIGWLLSDIEAWLQSRKDARQQEAA
jgi:prophage regulatory protein